MGDVLSKFIDPLRRLFPLPKSAEGHEDVFFEAYIGALGTFDDATLTDAAKLIVGTRQSRTFPLPADCSVACKEAIAERVRRAGRPDNRNEIRNTPFGERYPEWSDRRRQRADTLIQCDMGRQAAQEGWIWTLWEFCRENDRLPDPHEAMKVRTKGMSRSAEINEAVDKVDGVGDVAGLRKMREKIVDRLRHLVA